MSYQAVCQNCGYVLTSADIKTPVKNQAQTGTCRDCNSKKFKIIEREREVIDATETNDDEENDNIRDENQFSLDEYNE